MPNTPQHKQDSSKRAKTNSSPSKRNAFIGYSHNEQMYSYSRNTSIRNIVLACTETVLAISSSEENCQADIALCCCCSLYSPCCSPLGLFMTHKSGRQHFMRIHKQHATIGHVLLVNFARATFLRN